MHVYKGECRHCDGKLIEGFHGRWDTDAFPAGCSDCDGAESTVRYVGEMSVEAYEDLLDREYDR